MGNYTNHNWSVLSDLYGKCYVCHFQNRRILKKIAKTRNTPYYTAIEAFFLFVGSEESHKWE